MSLQPWIVELSPGTWLACVLDDDIETTTNADFALRFASRANAAESLYDAISTLRLARKPHAFPQYEIYRAPPTRLDLGIEALEHRLDADNARALVARCLAKFDAAGIEHGGCLESAIDMVLARLC